MAGQEGLRAVLVEQIGVIISGAPFATTRSRSKAEAILALLESGDLGVHLVASGDLQGSVGVVLRQLLDARVRVAELEQAVIEHQRICRGVES